jgi:Flp pilus assembly pilin Flp
MKATLRALLRGEQAQDLIEYALLTALLSVVSIIALQNLGGIMSGEWRMLILQLRHGTG